MDIVHALEEYGIETTICDPWANPDEVQREYGLSVVSDFRSLSSGDHAAIILAVAHNQFKEINETDLKALCAEQNVVFDIKNVLTRNLVDARL